MLAIEPIRKKITLGQFLLLLPFSERKNVYNTIESLIQKEKSFNIQHRILLKEDKESWALTGGSLLGEFKGEDSLLSLRIYDITRLKERETKALEMENRFQVSSELSGQMVFHWDIETGMMEWGGAIETMTGYTSKEFREVDIVTWATMVHPDDIEATLIELQKSYERSGIFNHIYRFRRKNDTYFYVESRGICFRSEVNGSFNRMEGVIEDIEYKRFAERALVASEKRFKAFYNLSNESMCFCELNTLRLLDANKTFWQMFQCDRKSLLEIALADLFIPESYTIVLSHIQSQNSGNINVYAKRQDGSTFPVILKQEKVEYMEHDSIFISILDLTTYKENELLKQANESIQNNNKLILSQKQELERTLVKLRNTQEQLIFSEKMAALGQLISGVAHEINNPIGAIYSSSGILEEMLMNILTEFDSMLGELQKIPAGIRNLFLEWIERSSVMNNPMVYGAEFRKLQKLIFEMVSEWKVKDPHYLMENITELAIYDDLEKYKEIFIEIESKNLWRFAFLIIGVFKNLRIIKISNKRISKIVYSLRSFTHNQNNEKKELVNIMNNIETVLAIHEAQFRNQVEIEKLYATNIPLVECFSESLHQVWNNLIYNAMQAIQFKGKIKIYIQNVEGYVYVGIEDNGPGIPAEIREKIFEPFFTTKPAGEGTGMGLGIVKSIVDKHRGKIEVESAPDRTLFKIYLPI